MNKEEFINSTTGRVVQTSIHLTPYWAFVPNPLPPSIKPSWKLVNLLSEADREIGIVAGLARNIPDASILIEPFMRREAVLSSRIEGTHTALSELYGYESGHNLPGYSRSNEVLLENQEVLNYVKALKVGLERIKTEPINLELIKELHRILLYGVRGDEFTLGEFRDIQNFIGRSNDPSEAIFIPTPVAELSGSVKKLENYLLSGNQYPPLIRIAMIHYQFETIHPFLDGNGRVGRLLIVLLLVSWKLLPEPLLYPSSFFERNRELYYENLLSLSKNGDWENWLEFFLQMIIEESKATITRAKAMIDLKDKWEKVLQKNKVSEHYFKIIDSLFTKPFISVSDIEKSLDVTNKAARSMVERLASLGILDLVEERKYGRIYQTNELIAILQKH